eukprot:TRINITY_DN2524_c0_g1_i1.p1 TRINITY_DN2524_c0_g1~~TRINITY_DN2524_c0_g1_i1.p1  ORF type:complete len:732 (-),score=157.04 TRINITY_DN2524_c0_g1_i1:18-2213(-)
MNIFAVLISSIRIWREKRKLILERKTGRFEMENPQGVPEAIIQVDVDDTSQYDFALFFRHGTALDLAAKEVRSIKSWGRGTAAIVPQDELLKHSNNINEKREAIVEQLKSVGLNIAVRPSVRDEDCRFVLVGASLSLLMRQAEYLDWELQVKESLGKHYEPFSVQSKDRFKPDSDRHFFSSLLRQHFIRTIIEGPQRHGGAELRLDELVNSGIVTKAYGLHEPELKQVLLKTWVRSVKKQPLETIRNYFGESISMYFAFLGFYAQWLFVASLVGIAAFVGSFLESDGWSNSLYSVFLAVWGTMMLNFWKRKSATLTWQWNMDNYMEKEQARPEFKGVLKTGAFFGGTWFEFDQEDQETGVQPSQSTYYSTGKRFVKIVVGMIPMALLVTGVIVITMGILTFRLYIQETGLALFGGVLGAAANAVTILILNKVYEKLAVLITNWENHRTQSSYDNMIILKTFLFQFVNSYISLYYIAFVKNRTSLWGLSQFTDKCSYMPISTTSYGCFFDLTIQVATMLGINIFVGQAQEVILPWVITRLKRCFGKHRDESTWPQYEKDALKEPYQSTVSDFNELVIQFGFLMLFAAAFPLAPAMALLNNFIEIRTDALKLLVEFNRPSYRGCNGIGVWYDIMEFIGVIGVLTNCLLITLTHRTLQDLFQNDMILVIIVALGLEHFLLFLKFLVSILIPDQPASVRAAKAKQEWMEEEAVKTLRDRRWNVDSRSDVLVQSVT